LLFDIAANVRRFSRSKWGQNQKIKRDNCLINPLLTGLLPEHYAVIEFVPNKFSSPALNVVTFIL
jgi:hypothetical protein